MNKRAKFLETTLEQQNRIDTIRSSFSNMYDVLDINCKDNEETKEAYRRLEEAQFWAIKGITRENKVGDTLFVELDDATINKIVEQTRKNIEKLNLGGI